MNHTYRITNSSKGNRAYVSLGNAGGADPVWIETADATTVELDDAQAKNMDSLIDEAFEKGILIEKI